MLSLIGSLANQANMTYCYCRYVALREFSREEHKTGRKIHSYLSKVVKMVYLKVEILIQNILEQKLNSLFNKYAKKNTIKVCL